MKPINWDAKNCEQCGYYPCDCATQRYDYGFSLWPDETWKFSREVIEMWQMLKTRIEFTWTEAEFERHRSAMSHIGFTMREIDRRPHLETETVL